MLKDKDELKQAFDSMEKNFREQLKKDFHSNLAKRINDKFWNDWEEIKKQMLDEFDTLKNAPPPPLRYGYSDQELNYDTPNDRICNCCGAHNQSTFPSNDAIKGQIIFWPTKTPSTLADLSLESSDGYINFRWDEEWV